MEDYLISGIHFTVYELKREILLTFSSMFFIHLGHKLANAMTAKVSLHVQICDLIGSLLCFI